VGVRRVEHARGVEQSAPHTVVPLFEQLKARGVVCSAEEEESNISIEQSARRAAGHARVAA